MNELLKAVKELTQHVNQIQPLRNYFESDATSYEHQKEQVIELKRLNKRVKQCLKQTP